MRAGAIVLGWRGLGVFTCLLLGSVSRAIVQRSRHPVLVVCSVSRSVRRTVLVCDASLPSRRAVRLLTAKTRTCGNRLVLTRVVEVLLVRIYILPKSVHAVVAEQGEQISRHRLNMSISRVESAAAMLPSVDWHVEGVLQSGMPLDTLLYVCDQHQADILVLGARAKCGVERVLLGSVTNGALIHAGIPVLIVL